MPPFRPLFSFTNINKKNFYFMTITLGEEARCYSPLKMTVKESAKIEPMKEVFTLPDLPDDYLEITLIDNDDELIEEITETFPLAISDVTEECILNSRKLSSGENMKETYLVELSTSFCSFNPGDTVGILTRNRDEDVKRLFRHLRITNLSSKKCKVIEKQTSLKKSQYKPSFVNKVTTLNYIFTHCLDIQCIPKKSLIKVLSQFTDDVKERRQLEELCCKEKSELYLKNVLEMNKTFLDLLLEFPSCCPPVVRLLENLPMLLPRPYSVVSSPLAAPNKVKIVFSVIKHNNDSEGLCTGMLKNIINNEQKEKRVKMFFRKSSGFNMPEYDVPLILVGPGTGIAPFLGFLQHKKMKKTGGIIWLFYGCRSKTGDFLFQKELQEYLDIGVLTKLCVAFSRDCDAEAKYVQDNIRKYGQEISKLIFDENALIYVCGDAKNMRKDIQNSFIEVFENQKGMTNKEATDYVRKLQKYRRYLQDIWF